MIDLYTWSTPNGRKVSIALEEMALAYRVHPIDIGKGEQFAPHFLKIAPNNRIPAIIDQDNGMSLFESGAILVYLGEKTGRFLPAQLRQRVDVMQWLFWQMGGLGPMAGQTHHFLHYAPEKIQYAIDRYVKETSRLYAVLDKRLADRPFVAGDYSIADMACYPWTVSHKRQNQDLNDFPNLKRWFEAIRARPAVERAYDKGKAVSSQPVVDDEARKFLFGQSAATVRR